MVSGAGPAYRGGGQGGGGVDWIGLDWCFALFGRAIPGSQVTQSTGPVTLTCEQPLYARGAEAGVPRLPTGRSPLPQTCKGHNGPPTYALLALSRQLRP